jgi:hypothetical protein
MTTVRLRAMGFAVIEFLAGTPMPAFAQTF